MVDSLLNTDEVVADSDTSDIRLPRLYERDIDVLIREELLFSAEVAKLFIRALKLPAETKVMKCDLSVVDGTGETDVLAILQSSSDQTALLIENKIDAAFQPTQPERYHLRAIAMSGADRTARSVLLCPEAYSIAQSDREHFDAVVSYEDVSKAVAAAGTPRAQDRAAMLLRAVQQARSASVMVPDAVVTAFYRRIYEMANKSFPSLKMKPPSYKGSNSSWHIFKGSLPRQIVVDWKIRAGTVGLSFWSGAPLRPPADTNILLLGPSARRREMKETIIIEMDTARAPSTDWTDLSDVQIMHALTDAVRMLDFYQTLLTRP